MSDIECFWTWLHETLPSISQRWHSRPDLSRIACCGESSGGYLTVNSALMFPHPKTKVMISISAPIDGDVPYMRIPRPRIMVGSRPPPPRQAEAIIRDYLKNMRPGAIRTGCEPSEQLELALCIFQQAYLPRYLGLKANPVLDIMKSLDGTKTVPPVWAIHGESDTMVRAKPSLKKYEAAVNEMANFLLVSS
jgi:acetyl esterase/lipase